MTQPLAMFGGTFDPVHLGHLCAAWEAAEALGAEVRLFPVSVPPHRPAPVASASARVAMLACALEGQVRLSLDTRELHRKGPSYTVDTLVELRADIGTSRALVLLLGADAFAGLPRWHRWREILTLAHVGVMTRPGEVAMLDDDLMVEVASRRVGRLAGPAGQIVDIPVTALDISATAIRAALAAGALPRYLLPPGVADRNDLLAPYRRQRPI
jgi:nicotinate-nucleotide adenylyltransferase